MHICSSYEFLPIFFFILFQLFFCFLPQAGPPGEKAIGLSQFLKNVITNAEVLLPSDLCIAPNKVSQHTHIYPSL